jgi:dephospho-CoA kinase
MLKVALTGGIATGKSYVLARLRDRGVATIDADDVVHNALGAGTPVSKAVVARFGDAVLNADGSIDRKLLAARVFTDADARAALEAVIHPFVYDAIQRWYSALDAALGVASIPLLFETQRQRGFDYVVVTACSPEQQVQRLMERGMTHEEAALRLAAQLPTAEKVNGANYVIDTSGTKAQTDEHVESVLAVLNRLVA